MFQQDPQQRLWLIDQRNTELVHAAEQELGQMFVIDLELELLHCPGVMTDDLSDTVDYAMLADAVAAIMAGPPQKLLEQVVGQIADRALAEPLAHRVRVEVRKPHVALPHRLAETAVRIERTRPSTYWLGIGANLGDRLANLQGIVDALRDAGVEIEAMSPVYDTAPREITDQPLRVDQTRTEQKAEPIGVCLLAQQTLGECRVQDPRKTLA